MKRIAALLMILLLICAGCAKTPTVKIGVLEPLSGEYAAGGQLEYQGIQEALKAYPMLDDARVELVVADNLSTEEGARQAAKSLIDQGVQIVIGSWGSSLTQAAAETLSKKNIPMVTTTASKIENNSCFALELTVTQQVQALSCLIAEQGWTRIAMVSDRNSTYDMAMRQGFIDTVGKEKICAEAHGTTENLADCIAAMEQEQADVLFIPSMADAAAGTTELPILGGDVSTSESVYHPIYAKDGARSVGYDGYLVAMAVLGREPKEIEGRTGRLVFDGATVIRQTWQIQTSDGVREVSPIIAE